MTEPEEHKAATAVIADVADDAKSTAEEAHFIAEMAHETATAALDAAESAPEEVPAIEEPEVTSNEYDEIRERISHLEGRMDAHEATHAEPLVEPEPAPESTEDKSTEDESTEDGGVIEVVTDNEAPKEEEAHDKPQTHRDERATRRFRRGR